MQYYDFPLRTVLHFYSPDCTANGVFHALTIRIAN